jgi:class 3 adenylate cyclase
MAGSGLATVMFTDLVGSTRMRERLGDDAADERDTADSEIIVLLDQAQKVAEHLKTRPLLEEIALTRGNTSR